MHYIHSNSTRTTLTLLHLLYSLHFLYLLLWRRRGAVMRREEAARPGRLPPRTRCLTAVPAILGRLIWDPSRDSDSVWDPSGIPKQGLRLNEVGFSMAVRWTSEPRFQLMHQGPGDRFQLMHRGSLDRAGRKGGCRKKRKGRRYHRYRRL